MWITVSCLESIVKDFKSGDAEKHAAALAKADQILEKEDKITSDRTVINKAAFKNDVSQTNCLKINFNY